MGQIKDGKHMYRAIEAHLTLYLSLYKIYIEELVENNMAKDLREGITTAVTDVKNCRVLEK